MFMLAHELGFGHPRLMYAELTADEIVDWLAYYSIEPFGERRDDWRMANIMALMANAYSAGKKRFKPSDFLPEEPRKPPSPDEVAMKVRSILARHSKRHATNR